MVTAISTGQLASPTSLPFISSLWLHTPTQRPEPQAWLQKDSSIAMQGRALTLTGQSSFIFSLVEDEGGNSLGTPGV
jgi:hypothetical protein